MRKAKRNAVKLENVVQQLCALKMKGDRAVRRKLADGMSSRRVKSQRVNPRLVQMVVNLKAQGVSFL